MSKLYSVYDLQLHKVDHICNQSNMNMVIEKIRDFANDDHDTTNISDNDLFVNWEFILFEHSENINILHEIKYEELLKNVPNIKVIYPRIKQ